MDKIVDWILFKVEYLFKLKIFVEDELNFIILNWFVVGLIKKCVIKLWIKVFIVWKFEELIDFDLFKRKIMFFLDK